MASELPPEQSASYSAIIDSILASADLNTISAKRIRRGLQEKVEYDITPQKTAITELIMLRFDKFQKDVDNNDDDNSTAAADGVTPVPEPAPTTNGTTKPTTAVKHESPSEPTSPTKRKASLSEEDDIMSDIIDASPPPPKKVKKTSITKAETDEELAKRMQAELNAPSARSTRGGGPKTKKHGVAKKAKTKESTPKQKTKAKSKAKLNSSDDSDLEGSDKSQKPERERKGGFHKPMLLSEPLSALLGGETTLSRPQTVKKIWQYVKERDLQDPSDKRQIRCDDAMRAVFKQDRVHMFTMNKLLAVNLFPADEQ